MLWHGANKVTGFAHDMVSHATKHITIGIKRPQIFGGSKSKSGKWEGQIGVNCAACESLVSAIFMLYNHVNQPFNTLHIDVPIREKVVLELALHLIYKLVTHWMSNV